jgi:hypothetical protein
VSGRIVKEVLEHAPEDLTPAQMLVYVALAEDARDHGAHARQARYESSLNALMRRTRLKSGTVRNALAELVGRGLIIPLNGRARPGLVQHYQLPELLEHHRGTAVADAPANDDQHDGEASAW